MQFSFVGPVPRYYGEEVIKFAHTLDDRISTWRKNGEVKDRDAGLVVLNPFFSSMQIWFMLTFGSSGADKFENALRKLYATRRTGMDTLDMHNIGLHMFWPGEFQYGGARKYRGLLGGLSGFTQSQDHFVVGEALDLLAEELSPVFTRAQERTRGKYVAPFPAADHSEFWVPLPELASDYQHGVSQKIPGLTPTPFVPSATGTPFKL